MLFDLEVGIALGVVASTLYFAYNYARSQEAAVREVPSSSGSVHSYEVAAVLELLSSRVVTCALGGFVFFGSSISMSQAVEKVGAHF
jgi:MFS superfamily sulfate permease-like transporter